MLRGSDEHVHQWGDHRLDLSTPTIRRYQCACGAYGYKGLQNTSIRAYRPFKATPDWLTPPESTGTPVAIGIPEQQRRVANRVRVESEWRGWQREED